VFYLRTSSALQWIKLIGALRSDSFDLLYANSLWSPTTTVIPVLAKRLGLLKCNRVTIAPRGELGQGALSIKAIKKRLFIKPWGRLLRSLSVEWHASTEREAADVHNAFPWARVKVATDSVNLPEKPMEPKLPTADLPRIVFVGRIARVKNLQVAIEALSLVTKPLAFDIYGPIEDRAYWKRCQAAIDELPKNLEVKYCGELAPGEVRRIFVDYDMFVFPTLGENFGHAIAESLSASCPVLCSDTTPWSQILRSGGGIVIPDPLGFGLANELVRFSELSPGDRLHARIQAGHAYTEWRKEQHSTSVLDIFAANRPGEAA
jgi:glycosyltransferase involved in cell wall biosynthesis